MGFGPAAGVRLVGTLSLFRSRHLFLDTLRRNEPCSGRGRNLNLTEQLPNPKSQIPSPNPTAETRAGRLCSVFWSLGFGIWGLGFAGATFPSPVRPDCAGHHHESLRFLPQDFHNCGKRCGKARGDEELDSRNHDFAGVLVRRKRAEAHPTALGNEHKDVIAGRNRNGRAKVPESLVINVTAHGREHLGPDPHPDRDQS